MNGAFNVSRNGADPRDIYFSPVPGIDLPDEQKKLVDDITQTQFVLRHLYDGRDEEFEMRFARLLSLAQAGLTGLDARPALARVDLDNLRREVVASEGTRVKNRYMRQLGLNAACLGLPALVFAYSFHWLRYRPMPLEATLATLWAGCMIGVWLSFGARNLYLSFDDLVQPEKDQVAPAIRLVFAGLITCVVGLLLSTSSVEVKIGTLSSTLIHSSYQFAMVVGVLCGLSEKTLPSALLRKAADFIG